MIGPVTASDRAWLARRYGKQVVFDEPLARHTSFRVGGPADALVTLDTDKDIAELLRWSQSSRVPIVALGNGTNVLAADTGFRGVILKVLKRYPVYAFGQGWALAQAGCRLAKMAALCAERGWGGIEFAAGIPGTLGGAAAMNAGAWGHSMSDVLTHVTGLDRAGQRIHWTRDELAMSYRHTRLLDEFVVLTHVELALAPRTPDDILDTMRDYAARRRASQPMTGPSAGSVFQNPPGHSAGRLIDAAGCKGMRIGDALVSAKHANFFVNAGCATAGHVVALVLEVRERVARTFGVTLQPEISFLGYSDAWPGRRLLRSVE